MNWRTFKIQVEYYEKYKILKPHGNKGKTPINKTPKHDVEELLEKFDALILKVEKYYGKNIPLTLSSLFFNLHLEYLSENKKMPIVQSTFYKIMTRIHRNYISKYSDKRSRRLLRKIIRLKKKILEMRKNYFENKSEVEKITIAQKILDISDTKVEYKPSPMREYGNPGEIVLWDGSIDPFINQSKVTRMHLMDQKTLFSMGMSFVKHENNQSYKELTTQMVDYGIPLILKCDRRKGVDPIDEGALIAIIMKFLNVTIMADSNSVHKTDLEKINGNMHPLVLIYAAKNNIQTIEELRRHTPVILKLTNQFFKKEEPDFSHLRQATKMQKEILLMDLKQYKIRSQDGIIFNKIAYQAIGTNKNPIDLARFEWTIVASENSIPKYLWTSYGIFELKKISKEMMATDLKAISSIMENTNKHFVNNGVMIANRETITALYKMSRNQGFKDAIRHKQWQLNEQINKMIFTKRKLSEELIEIRNKLNK